MQLELCIQSDFGQAKKKEEGFYRKKGHVLRRRWCRVQVGGYGIRDSESLCRSLVHWKLRFLVRWDQVKHESSMAHISLHTLPLKIASEIQGSRLNSFESHSTSLRRLTRHQAPDQTESSKSHIQLKPVPITDNHTLFLT